VRPWTDCSGSGFAADCRIEPKIHAVPRASKIDAGNSARRCAFYRPRPLLPPLNGVADVVHMALTHENE
jgi:hypothetical protein